MQVIIDEVPESMRDKVMRRIHRVNFLLYHFSWTRMSKLALSGLGGVTVCIILSI